MRPFEIFLATAPGLEDVLRDEAASKGFARSTAVAGGVTVHGGWADVWRANLWLRGASKVIARVDRFEVDHLGGLEARARRTPWGAVLRRDVAFRVEASCSKSRIYHSAAAAERVARAISDSVAAPVAEAATVSVMVRIERDVCSIGIDTSGELLHLRGFKAEVGRAPMRETMAALFLRQCGYDGREPVVDPMCGSGTFVIEAAEIAAGLNPGRGRSFAFEQLATFDVEAWRAMRATSARPKSDHLCHGSDRDAAAIMASRANAERAGLAARTAFLQRPVSELLPPDGPPGLIIVNPPYGARIGDKDKLAPLHAALGRVLRERFKGWRVGLVTSEKGLAYATGLPWLPTGPPVAHGGLRVTLFRTAAL